MHDSTDFAWQFQPTKTTRDADQTPPVTPWGRSIAEFKTRKEQIPTLFGKLAYVGSLWTPQGFKDPARPESTLAMGVAQTYLGANHWSIFIAWLAQRIRDQRTDLSQYLTAHGVTSQTALEEWRARSSYLSLIPESAAPPERSLFRDDMWIVLELIAEQLVR